MLRKKAENSRDEESFCSQDGGREILIKIFFEMTVAIQQDVEGNGKFKLSFLWGC
jgi:hypothetical protein